MVDITYPVAGGATKKLRDMSDATHAEIIAAVLASSDGSLIDVTTDGEIFTTSTEREKNVFVLVHDNLTAEGTEWTGAIDLSDTTNWPHDATGRIDISSVIIKIDKTNSATGQLWLGVITRIDATDADVSMIIGRDFLKASSGTIDMEVNVAPAQMKLGVSGGALTSIKTARIETAVTAINTVSTISFNGNTFTPAVGDVVVMAQNGASSEFTFTIQIGYHAHDGI